MQRDEVEQLLGSFTGGLVRSSYPSWREDHLEGVVSGLVRRSQHHVLEDGQTPDDAWRLEGAGQAASRDQMGTETLYRLAFEDHLTFVGRVETGDQIERCGLPRSIRTDQRG